VLVLLFPDVQGRLRVVLTLRSEKLRNFAGQVALPGDSLGEAPEETARREAYEEIGLPLEKHNFVLPVPAPSPEEGQLLRLSTIQLTELPCSLSKNNMVVRPVVAILLPTVKPPLSSHTDLDFSDLTIPTDLESILIPRLDPKEVSAVFSVPLEAFLSTTFRSEYLTPPSPMVEKWYAGELLKWIGNGQYMHQFMAPVWAHRAVTAGGKRAVTAGGKRAARAGYNDKLLTPEDEAVLMGDKGKIQGDENAVEANLLVHYRVFGMTARILIDAARIAYDKEPEFKCLPEKGDEDLVAKLWDYGMLRGERVHGEEFVLKEMFRKGNL